MPNGSGSWKKALRPLSVPVPGAGDFKFLLCHQPPSGGDLWESGRPGGGGSPLLHRRPAHPPDGRVDKGRAAALFGDTFGENRQQAQKI